MPARASRARSAFGHGDELVIDEDCLFLNVWTPGLDAGKRPVMVWLHGGGFTTGSGASDAFDGTNLARHEDVVVVTINHRLGLLAFTHLGDVGGDAYADSGNAGTLDMVAALQWVRDNIEAFGGDPGNLTIFGESGGGGKVNVLLATPAANGLFQRAICQSGVAGGLMQLPERAGATADAERFLAELGLQPGDLAPLSTSPLERLLEADRALAGGGLMGSGGVGRSPVIDGRVLPSQPFDAVADGTAADVPLIVGTTRDEGATFFAGIPAMRDLSRDDLAGAAAMWTMGVPADDLVALYERNRPGATPGDLVISLMSDAAFRIPSIELAERRLRGASAPTYMYLFTWESPVLGGILKAGHGLDIRFVSTTSAPRVRPRATRRHARSPSR
jgi:para-nitrobenzyl esterase